jgi:SAM-dependent MidA family methyltransferase
VSERIEFGLRRAADLEPNAPLPESDPRLVARLRAEIEASGPLTFARFIDIALYDPDAGYYAGGRAAEAVPAEAVPAEAVPAEAVRAPVTAGRGPGRAGDFLTAPESHPIFGWAIARRLEQVWVDLDRPRPFVVREHGAGAGALAVGILDGLRRSGSPLLEAVRYQAIDVAPAATAAFAAALEGAGLSRFVEAADGRSATGAVIANELLDALPFHRVEGTAAGGVVERYVVAGPEGGFATELGPPSTPALAARLEAEGIRLEPGQAAEICLALDDWVRAAAASLECGLLLVIDYGHPADRLYAPGRGSTLRAYHRHRVHDDPFVAIGRQDLTAHVDLTAVERAAVAAGLDPIGRTTQAEYLASLGLGDLLVALQTEPGAALETYLAARSAVVRMLDPRASGGFAVVEFARAAPAAGG